jgi:hypothetical protein
LTLLFSTVAETYGTKTQMPYPSFVQALTELPWIVSAIPPEPPLLSVWMPLPDLLMRLSRNWVPVDQLAEIASLALVTVL